MKKLTKLIGTFGISLGSLFFNRGYSQEKGYFTVSVYQFNGKAYSHKYETVDGNGRTWTRYYNVDKNNPTIQTEISPWQITNNLQNSTKSYNKSNTKKNSDLDNALIIGNTAVGVLWLINELSKPRNKVPITNSVPPVNNPPTNYNLNPKNNVYWWKEDKNNKNWWEDANDKPQKTADKTADIIAEILPGGEIMIKADKEFIDFMKDKNGKNYWEEGYSGSSPEEIKNYVDKKLAGELKKAEEFYEKNQKNARQPKCDDTLRIGSYKFNKIGTRNYDYKESKIEKIIIYEGGKTVKEINPHKVGDIIGGMETYNEIKEKDLENWIAEKTKEAKEVDFLFFNTKDIYYKNSGKEKSLWNKMNETPNFIKYIALKNAPGGGIFIRVAKVVEKSASSWWDE